VGIGETKLCGDGERVPLRRTLVAIVDRVPTLQRALTGALASSGFEPVDLDDAQLAVVAVRSDSDWERLRRSAVSTTTVALLDSDQADGYEAALRAGAIGAAAWTEPIEEVVAVVTAAAEGRTRLPSTVARGLTGTAPREPDVELSATDRTLLHALCQGLTVATIATHVGYSEREVHRRLRKLYGRLGLRGRADALIFAVRHGLVEPPAQARRDSTGT